MTLTLIIVKEIITGVKLRRSGYWYRSYVVNEGYYKAGKGVGK
jgi:hypothetical protein